MLAQLFVTAGPDAGRSFPLEDGQSLSIGRGAESDTHLKDAQASRRHCLLQVVNGRFELRDQHSAGGTYVNGERVEQCKLRVGDIVRIGQTELQLRLDAVESQTTQVAEPFAMAVPKPHAGSLKNLVGQSLAHFKLEKVLAQGGNGIVFLARDEKEDRLAAVKVLWPEISRQEDQMQRFVRAMKTMMPIRHENIVSIYAAGKNGPHCWVAMEYVEGEPLTAVIDRIGTQGMLDWRHAFRVAVHVARALEAAYEHQIVHRNVTPQNILLRNRDKMAKLGDLMLAKALEGALARPVTQPGQLVGDLVYMAPERTVMNETVDCRADIYGLGATVYALLTGRPPFEARSAPEVVAKIRKDAPVKPKQFQLSIVDRFQDCVLQMLEKRPDDRYQTPRKLLVDLNRIAMYENIEI